ncbi:MAG: CinA family protein [Lachnospiraceae bacterium]|nr:CinA family protein [Lachnospiraceae bacterium]
MTTEERIVHLCIDRKLKITCAESCTGGLLAARLVSVAGASECFERSFVTYSDMAKHEELLVSLDTLSKWTAVSEQAAREMAMGARKRARADIALSVTGYAGPDSGNGETVGLVYIGCAEPDRVFVKRQLFLGERNEIREQAAERALEIAEKVLLKETVKKC